MELNVSSLVKLFTQLCSWFSRFLLSNYLKRTSLKYMHKVNFVQTGWTNDYLRENLIYLIVIVSFQLISNAACFTFLKKLIVPVLQTDYSLFLNCCEVTRLRSRLISVEYVTSLGFPRQYQLYFRDSDVCKFVCMYVGMYVYHCFCLDSK